MSLPHSAAVVRDATTADIDAITLIYAWHVLHRSEERRVGKECPV